MGVDGQIAPLCQIGDSRQKRRRTALGRRWTQAPNDPATAIPDAVKLTLDEFELRRGIAGGVADERPQVFRHDLAYGVEGIQLGSVAHRDRVGDPDAGLFIGIQYRIYDFIGEWEKRAEILNGRYPVSQSLDRTEKSADTYLLETAIIADRSRDKTPLLERHRVKAALRQDIMRVIVGIDETREQDMPR